MQLSSTPRLPEQASPDLSPPQPTVFTAPGAQDEHVLIMAPVGQDALAMASLITAHGFQACVCAGPAEVSRELFRGAGTLLLTEESLELPLADDLSELLRRQPPWSELPVIILTSGGDSRLESLLDQATRAAGTVTLLERPLATNTLLRSLEVALRSRRRQYQVRDLLAEQERTQKALRQSEAQLHQHAEALERAVSERTARLNDTVHELEAFSYSIAHDLRAPLRAMNSFSQLLREGYAERLDDTGRDFLERISRSAARLDTLIQDVLNYTQVIRGSAPLSHVDLNALIHDILSSYPNFQLPLAEVRLEGNLPPVLGHVGFLTQTISNLLSNAVKFVRPGESPRVIIRGGPASSPQFVRLWIVDNGIGIAPEDRERIFRMFERIHPADAYEGTGIGLTIVKKAIERMNGRFGFDSAPGQGSKFWIELPAAASTPET